ncbi:vacuolar calcium ion transporter [Aspergillus nomiae NRRL 13137]|uniref:Vacuolar calcium ion transporter n=1 Tax=Aspergillus nomiae NRRL (strain ATCC 15546 / NRRL 13137 / CBS 260.88 / M93) TaxID=1509407 RepID=A0A0L1JGY7_ASPN3|nr:vacuolar calcium ion transporter [Aspergillus nomiae NRRL 13137]KNG91029.1 vacuolar calcium ion transporter [Aspergillus nomiae NRRL 13137]
MITVHSLLVFLPLGVIAALLNWNSVLVSVFNFLAILPLSAIVSDASDTLSDYFGDLVGGLINATFGNAVELSTGILAVASGDTYFAQSVMIGSILSDILLIMGGCLISASYNKHILYFNMAQTGSLSSLMVVTAVGLILPSVLYATFTSVDLEDQVLSFSRGTSTVLLVLYVGYLYFQLGTHAHLFQQEPNAPQEDEADQGENKEKPDLSKTVLTLVAAGTSIVICSHFFLASVPATSAATRISKTFIATILIPITSNCPEGVAVIAASFGGGDVTSLLASLSAVSCRSDSLPFRSWSCSGG